MLRHKANMEDGYRVQYSLIEGDIGIKSNFHAILVILRCIGCMICNNQDFFKILHVLNMPHRIIETSFSY